MKLKALKPFIEDDDDFVRNAIDASSRRKLIQSLIRRRAWLFWFAIAATVLLVVSLSISITTRQPALAGTLLAFILFWMTFSECNTTLRMLRLFEVQHGPAQPRPECI